MEDVDDEAGTPIKSNRTSMSMGKRSVGTRSHKNANAGKVVQISDQSDF